MTGPRDERAAERPAMDAAEVRQAVADMGAGARILREQAAGPRAGLDRAVATWLDVAAQRLILHNATGPMTQRAIDVARAARELEADGWETPADHETHTDRDPNCSACSAEAGL